MGESDGGEQDWAQAWIDEQREKLRRSATNNTSSKQQSSEIQELAAKWLALGQGMWRGLEQFSAGIAADGPPLGWAREYEQDWRELAQAQAEYARLEAELLALIGQVQSEALSQLERAIRERAGVGPGIKDFRELYDLWIECGEQVYAETARSERFCKVQAAFGNAVTKQRASQQKIIERALKQFDLPTRSEINSVHRQLRDLRERLEDIRIETRAGSVRTSTRTAQTPGRKQKKSAKRRAGRISKKA